MGFSVSAAALIVGISLLIAFEGFTTAIVPLVSDVHQSYSEMMDKKTEASQVSIDIIDVTTNFNGSGYVDCVIDIENTGSSTITLQRCSLLIDGVLTVFHTNDSFLFPGRSATLSVNHLPLSGLTRMKLVTEHNIATYIEVNI
jgi:archaellum component FlaF (FlaF/FlaG flagellin family)